MKKGGVSSAAIGYQSHVDGLRAWAVISVLLFHLAVEGFLGGFVGVDIFFVISGFLITRLIKVEIESTGFFRFQEFYFRRLRRLLPAYLLMLVMTITAAALLFSPSHLERFGVALSSSVISVSNFYFWFEADYFDVSAQFKPLLHTWTLGVEEQFYLIWPISLVLLLKLGSEKLLLGAVLLVSCISLYLNDVFGDGEVELISRLFPRYGATLISNGESTIFFLLPFRIFEFMIGGGLVWMVKVKSPRAIYEFLFLTGIGMLAYSIVFFDEALLFPSYYALLPCLGTAFLIYSGGNVFASSILENRVSVNVGLISYSLYLFHWPVIVFWQYVIAPNQLRMWDKGGIFVLSFLLATASYHLVEKRFRNKDFSIGVKKWKVAVPLCVLIFGVGLHMKVTGGWPRAIPYTVNFDNVGSAANYQRKYNGGAGYPDFGSVNTNLPPDVILVGDSHGKHYAEGVYEEFTQPNNLSLYIVSGNSCFHLPGFTRITKGKNWDRICPNAVSQVVKLVKMAKSAPTVIISHSWVSQMNRADLLDEEGEARNVLVKTEDIIKSLKIFQKMIFPARLVVIGNVPASNGRNLYDIFTRPKVVMSADFDLNDYLVSEIRPQLREFNLVLKSAAEESGEFIFLDPFNVLCDTYCNNLDNEKRLIYSDSSHLSKHGSRLVISKFATELLEIQER